MTEEEKLRIMIQNVHHLLKNYSKDHKDIPDKKLYKLIKEGKFNEYYNNLILSCCLDDQNE